MVLLELDASKKYHKSIDLRDEYTFVLGSDDCTSCEIVNRIISTYLDKDGLLFKASGLTDNIEEIARLNTGDIQYYEGKRHMFFSKMPECFFSLEQANLNQVLDEWVSTIYERRYIYVYPRENHDKIVEILDKYAYKDSNNLVEIWPFIDCLIENYPDAYEHNTFIITVKDNKEGEVKDIICSAVMEEGV